MQKTDVLIIGGGLAAMMTASKLVSKKNVTMVLKGKRTEGNSWKAQGGVAVALASGDSADLHMQDTLEAGCYQNNKELVDILVHEGPTRLVNWIKQGLSFDRASDGSFLFGKEGAHSQRRILHAGGDRTGNRTMDYFSAKLSDRFHMIECQTVVDLIVEDGICKGALLQNELGNVYAFHADQTVIATGGVGGLFQETSNDEHITGDGIALAFRGGVELHDLEFIQFHPTLIISDDKAVGLASEALRGEGAVLVNSEGKQLMTAEHPLADLAPRDVVSRVLYTRIQYGEKVFLDISGVENVDERFPQIKEICLKYGVNWHAKRIPVRPGAHFHMGGIKTDEHGRTTIENLFAVGEAAGSGVHGANRLASNSLLEAIVFGERTGEWIAEMPSTSRKRSELGSEDTEIRIIEPELPSVMEIRKQVTKALGVVRTEKTLNEFLNWLKSFDIDRYRFSSRKNWSKSVLQRSNMMFTAFLIAEAAMKRKQSLGAHYIQAEGERTEDEPSFIETAIN